MASKSWFHRSYLKENLGCWKEIDREKKNFDKFHGFILGSSFCLSTVCIFLEHLVGEVGVLRISLTNLFKWDGKVNENVKFVTIQRTSTASSDSSTAAVLQQSCRKKCCWEMQLSLGRVENQAAGKFNATWSENHSIQFYAGQQCQWGGLQQDKLSLCFCCSPSHHLSKQTTWFLVCFHTISWHTL